MSGTSTMLVSSMTSRSQSRRVEKLAFGDGRCMAYDGDQVATAANLHPEDGKAAVRIEKRHALDRTRDSFPGRGGRLDRARFRHKAMYRRIDLARPGSRSRSQPGPQSDAATECVICTMGQLSPNVMACQSRLAALHHLLLRCSMGAGRIRSRLGRVHRYGSKPKEEPDEQSMDFAASQAPRR